METSEGLDVGSWKEDMKGLKEADDKEPCNHSIGEKLVIYGYWNLLNTILMNNIVNEFATVEGNGQRILLRGWTSEAGRKRSGDTLRAWYRYCVCTRFHQLGVIAGYPLMVA